MSILDKFYVTKMQDGTRWSIPVRVIAENRAKYYAEKYGITLEESLIDDTLPLFESASFEVEYWATRNMKWSDVSNIAVRFDATPVDYADGWVNGHHEIKD